MFEIYKLSKYNDENNNYVTGRTQDWVIKKDKTFESYDDAKQYIMEQTKKNTTFINLSTRLSTEAKKKFLHQFCFEKEMYLMDREYFIGYPPVDKLKAELKLCGIKVE